jgi:ABC-type transport system involved in cytochrome c biogenesis permease subunit
MLYIHPPLAIAGHALILIIWAQIAWGSFWTWDPKETLTLILFSTFSTSLLFYFENKVKITTCLSFCSCVLVVITIMSSFIIAGLHSFN